MRTKKIDDFIIKKTSLSFCLIFLLALILLLPSLIFNSSILDYFGGIGGLLIYGIAWIPIPQYFVYILAKHYNKNIWSWILLSLVLGWLTIFIVKPRKQVDTNVLVKNLRNDYIVSAILITIVIVAIFIMFL